MKVLNFLKEQNLSEIQVAILAGGLGTRLRPITEKIPKPLVEVAGRPYLEWQFDYLKKFGFKNILLLTGHLGDQVEKHFGNGHSLGLEISYSHEKSPLGTGGALLNAANKLKDQFILLNGDSFLPLDFGAFLKEFSQKKWKALISLYDNSTPTDVPENIKIDNDGKITAYEKGAGTSKGFSFVDSGVYALDISVFADETLRVCSLEADLLNKFRAQGLVGGFVSPERFYDIGTPERKKLFEETCGRF